MINPDKINYAYVEEGKLFPSTLLGSLAGVLGIRLSGDKLTREKQFIEPCIAHLCGRTQ